MRPNRFAPRHIQWMLGGEEHEDYICIDWYCRPWRCCTLKRRGISDACHRSDANIIRGGPRRVRLQRVGSLLAPSFLRLRLRLLPSALLGRMGLAPALLASQLVPLASLAQLEHRLLTIADTRRERGASPFLFCRCATWHARTLTRSSGSLKNRDCETPRRRRCSSLPLAGRAPTPVIACDKREAFAQGSVATKQSSRASLDCFASLA
jgi:hypothetical protein